MTRARKAAQSAMSLKDQLGHYKASKVFYEMYPMLLEEREKSVKAELKACKARSILPKLNRLLKKYCKGISKKK